MASVLDERTDVGQRAYHALEAQCLELEPVTLISEKYAYRCLSDGHAGIAYWLYCLWRMGDRREDILTAAEMHAVHALSLAPEAVPNYARSAPVVSLLHGRLGSLLVRALIANGKRDAAALRSAAASIVQLDTSEAALPAGNPHGIFAGAGGIIVAFLALKGEFATTAPELTSLRELADTVAEQIVYKLRTVEINAAARPSLGFAAGLAGDIYLALRYCTATNKTVPTAVTHAIEALDSAWRTSDLGVTFPIDPQDYSSFRWAPASFCNGLSGMIHMWLAAFEAFGDRRFLLTARRFGLACQGYSRHVSATA